VSKAYRLTSTAEKDILAIYLTGFHLFGEAQADRYHRELQMVFELIAQHPEMARERLEIIPPIRVHPHRAHLVIYRIDLEGVLVLRVRHSHEDWADEPI
jgi:toxin ParE1/3/4